MLFLCLPSKSLGTSEMGWGRMHVLCLCIAQGEKHVLPTNFPFSKQKLCRELFERKYIFSHSLSRAFALYGSAFHELWGTSKDGPKELTRKWKFAEFSCTLRKRCSIALNLFGNVTEIGGWLLFICSKRPLDHRKDANRLAADCCIKARRGSSESHQLPEERHGIGYSKTRLCVWVSILFFISLVLYFINISSICIFISFSQYIAKNFYNKLSAKTNICSVKYGILSRHCSSSLTFCKTYLSIWQIFIYMHAPYHLVQHTPH